MKATVVLAIAFAACLGAASAKPVTHLTAKNFDETVADGKMWFIKLYAPWCGHCKSLAPTWEKLAAEFEGHREVGIASVDCTKEKAVCDKAGVKGFPTLKTFINGEEKEKYAGARGLPELKTFVESQRKLLMEATTA